MKDNVIKLKQFKKSSNNIGFMKKDKRVVLNANREVLKNYKISFINAKTKQDIYNYIYTYRVDKLHKFEVIKQNSGFLKTVKIDERMLLDINYTGPGTYIVIRCRKNLKSIYKILVIKIDSILECNSLLKKVA